MHDKICKKVYVWLKKCQLSQSFLQKDREKIKRLYPGEPVEERLEKYYVETIKLLMKIGMAGVAIAIILGMSHCADGQEEITYLERNEYSEGVGHVDIVGYGKNGYELESSLVIREREYTEQELQSLYVNFLPVLEEKMLGGNKSLGQVNMNLIFPVEVSGFPFDIKWRSIDRSVINNNGKLAEEYRSTKKETSIVATISYGEFWREHTWNVMVVPGEWTSESVWKFNLEKALKESDDESIESLRWNLPTELDGEKIHWKIQEKNRWIEMLLLFLICPVLVIWGRHNDLQRRIKKRDLALEKEYSNIVTKLALYLGAGMTVKSAWKKTATDSGKWMKDGVAINEMLLASREMDSGIYESVCYENFGRRCGRQEYVRLGTLLAQNLKKGNSELLNRLQEEAELAGEKQKHLVKRQGEEASTKLLGPMIILLGITMVLIMIPAFSGIG